MVDFEGFSNFQKLGFVQSFVLNWLPEDLIVFLLNIFKFIKKMS